MNISIYFSEPFRNAFASLRMDLFQFGMYYINIALWLIIFMPAVNSLGTRTQEGYVLYFLPGLLIFSVIGSSVNLALNSWSSCLNGSIQYWFTLPVSIRFLLFRQIITAMIYACVWSSPLMVLNFLVKIEFSFILVIIWFLILALTSNIIFLVNFVLIIALFRSNYFYIIFGMSQALYSRLSSMYYPLIYIPTIFLIFSIINPFTWAVEAMRDSSLIFFVLFFLILAFFLLFLITEKYWKFKKEQGWFIT